MATSPSATPTQYVWFGGTGDFGHSSDWSPKGVPVSGDTAISGSDRDHLPAELRRLSQHVTDGLYGGVLNLTKPMEFLGSIVEGLECKVVLATNSTSASYADGVLTVLDHARTVVRASHHELR